MVEFGGLLGKLFDNCSYHICNAANRIIEEVTAERTWSVINITSKTIKELLTTDDSSKSEPTRLKPRNLASTEGTLFNDREHGNKQGNSKSTDQFKEECQKRHNYYREKHGVPLLTLSPKLCDFAQEWADHLAETDTFYHRPENKYGENLYMEWGHKGSGKVSGERPVDSWYREIEVHTFGQEPDSLASGHFTQLIWKDSKELGVAYRQNRAGKTYVVANYDPHGNVIGRFSSNVPPPLQPNI